MKPITPHLLLTCEHGGNHIPPPYRALFRGAGEVLKSHRGWDPGAVELADRCAKELTAPLFSATVSRLLIELNRSLHHRSLFSQYTRDLDQAAKAQLIGEYYQPYRTAVEEHVAQQVKQGERVLHVSVHSFTPELDGEVRNADVGLLYDPARPWERSFCDDWRKALLAHDSGLRVRKNYPYLGSGDGFTTYLRTRFSNSQYAGIEIEVNQRFPQRDKKAWQALQGAIVETLMSPFAPRK
jgi:predicted N-formylglutamate amidohydrolase